jgi:hypothetical protein
MTLVAEFHPVPRVLRDAPPDPLPNPARQRLAETIAALDRARGAVELAAEPVRRLTDVIAEHDRLAAQVRERIDRDQTATGAWIAGGRVGADPGDQRLCSVEHSEVDSTTSRFGELDAGDGASLV